MATATREQLSLLGRPCPVCGVAYGEHSLDSLATCMDDALGEEADPEWWAELVPARVMETVRGPTLRAVL